MKYVVRVDFGDHCHHRPRAPIDALIRAHGHSLRVAKVIEACDRRRDVFIRECPPLRCDFECRVLLNAARRQIDELRRQCGINQYQFLLNLCQSACDNRAHEHDRDQLGTALATPPVNRKSYAMPPVDFGASTRSETSAPPWRCAQQAHAFPEVTNLGTLMDVLG